KSPKGRAFRITNQSGPHSWVSYESSLPGWASLLLVIWTVNFSSMLLTVPSGIESTDVLCCPVSSQFAEGQSILIYFQVARHSSSGVLLSPALIKLILQRPGEEVSPNTAFITR